MIFAVNKRFSDESIYKSESNLPSPKAGRGDRTPKGVWWVRQKATLTESLTIAFRSLLYRFVDPFTDARKIAVNFSIRNAKHLVAAGFQNFIPFPIIITSCIGIVLGTVQFQNHFCF